MSPPVFQIHNILAELREGIKNGIDKEHTTEKKLILVIMASWEQGRISAKKQSKNSSSSPTDNDIKPALFPSVLQGESSTR